MDENNKNNKPIGEKEGKKKRIFTSFDYFETYNATGKTS